MYFLIGCYVTQVLKVFYELFQWIHEFIPVYCSELQDNLNSGFLDPIEDNKDNEKYRILPYTL